MSFHPDLLFIRPPPHEHQLTSAPLRSGTCLTITALDPAHPPFASFKLGLSPETLRRTTLSALQRGSHVNLERAVRADTRMGGHFVQGHVDTTARIVQRSQDGNAVTYRLRPRDQAVLRWVVEKGYVALDGASLTVGKVGFGGEGMRDQEVGGAGREFGWWEVMLVAYTQEKVVMASKGVGEDVNVEVDMVGKYVEKSVRGYFEDESGSQSGGAMLQNMVRQTVQEILREQVGKPSADLRLEKSSM